MQEQLPVHRRQEEQDSLQGLPTEKVPHGRHVQVRLALRPTLKLVQNSLPDAAEHSAQPAEKPARHGGRNGCLVLQRASLTTDLLVNEPDVPS